MHERKQTNRREWEGGYKGRDSYGNEHRDCSDPVVFTGDGNRFVIVLVFGV